MQEPFHVDRDLKNNFSVFSCRQTILSLTNQLVAVKLHLLPLCFVSIASQNSRMVKIVLSANEVSQSRGI